MASPQGSWQRGEPSTPVRRNPGARLGKAGAKVKADAGGLNTRRGLSFVADVVQRAVEESQRERSFPSWKGKERAYDDEHAAHFAVRAIEPANMQPQVVATSDSSHHASARVGVSPSSAAPAASTAAASQPVVASSAVQSTPTADSSAAFPAAQAVSSTSAPAQSPASSSAASQTEVVSSTVQALTSASTTPSPSSTIGMSDDMSSSLSATSAAASSSLDALSSSSLSASASTAEASAASAASTPHKISLAHNTPLMVFVILGSIIGGATVLFGLAWLCKRSSLGPTRSRKQKALSGNWSPGAGSSKFSPSSEIPEILFTQKPSYSAAVFPERPPPAMPPSFAENNYSNTYYSSYGRQNAPGGPQRQQGWELFDRPLEMQPVVFSPLVDGAGAVRPNAPRRPTFIQKALQQPERGATLDLEARLSLEEQAREAVEEGASRSNTTSSTKSTTSAILHALGLTNSTSNGKGKHSSWSTRIRRKSTSVPDDSDFEGTIGAPDKEVPRAHRVKKGRRFACDVTSGEEDSSPEDGPPPMPAWPPRQYGLCMYASQSTNSTPKTPGMAGMGAGGGRRSAPMDRFHSMPIAGHSSTVPGRQLLVAPGLTPVSESNAADVLGAFARLQRQHQVQALNEDDLNRRASAPPAQDREAAVKDKVTTWWTGSWDAEWPSPTASQRELGTVPEGLLSPRSIEIPAPSSTFAHSDREEEEEVEVVAGEAQPSSPSSISSQEVETPPSSPTRDEYMLRAQNSLKRMTSIRPNFAPATTLDSWLDAANGPRDWMKDSNVIIEEEDDNVAAEREAADMEAATMVGGDEVGLGYVGEPKLGYQGSLKSPMVLTNDLPSDFFVESDDEDYRALRNKSSASTLRSSNSNATLRSSMSKRNLRASASHELMGGVATPRLGHRSSVASLDGHSYSSHGHKLPKSVRKQRSFRQQQLQEKRLSLAVGDSPDYYIDSDGYEVRKVGGLSSVAQPSRASLVVRKESIRGQTSDVSDYECEAEEEKHYHHQQLAVPEPTALSEYEAIFARSSESFHAPEVAAAVAAAGDVRKLRGKSSQRALKTARSMSCIEEVDRALMALAIKRQALAQSQSKLGSGKVRRQHGRRAVSTGQRAFSSGLARPQSHGHHHQPAPPPIKPRYGHVAGDASPSSSSDSDISVRRWGRPTSSHDDDADDISALPYISGSDDDDEFDGGDYSVGNITIGPYAGMASTHGAIADWNAAKRRRGARGPMQMYGNGFAAGSGRMRVASAGVVAAR